MRIVIKDIDGKTIYETEETKASITISLDKSDVAKIKTFSENRLLNDLQEIKLWSIY